MNNNKAWEEYRDEIISSSDLRESMAPAAKQWMDSQHEYNKDNPSEFGNVIVRFIPMILSNTSMLNFIGVQPAAPLAYFLRYKADLSSLYVEGEETKIQHCNLITGLTSEFIKDFEREIRDSVIKPIIEVLTSAIADDLNIHIIKSILNTNSQKESISSSDSILPQLNKLSSMIGDKSYRGSGNVTLFPASKYAQLIEEMGGSLNSEYNQKKQISFFDTIEGNKIYLYQDELEEMKFMKSRVLMAYRNIHEGIQTDAGMLFNPSSLAQNSEINNGRIVLTHRNHTFEKSEISIANSSDYFILAEIN